ncbi:MAG TPA: M20/M25/M40 family metallo-hydrolase [Candidatus Limnocylindrales bacterium]
MNASLGPAAGIDPSVLASARGDVVTTLRELIRIPSVNPPEPAAADGELRAARHIASILEDAGVPAEIHEPFPGRGSVTARLHGDGTGGEPLLLLSHLDVVPAPSHGWTHDPFGGDLADGYVWGRGAVDMKQMTALEVGVVRLLAGEARAAGRDPASDPIPGLRRDVLFASTADEEAGGHQGIGWLVGNRPETLQAAGCLNECGGMTTTVGGVRLYPIGVAEKGFCVYRITVRGTWGHGSVPRPDNAAVMAADIVARLAVPGPIRLTDPMIRFFASLQETLPPDLARACRAMLGDDPRAAELVLERLCDPMYARVARALVRETLSPTVIAAGVKYNVIPGVAEVVVDCRVLPGTTEDAMRAEVERRIGDLLDEAEIELVIAAVPVESPVDTDLYRVLEGALREHDPEGVPVPVMLAFATDAKHTARLGIPTYGFSPLLLDPEERFLERFHGVDERVGVKALEWGLPVMYDVVRRFCG